MMFTGHYCASLRVKSQRPDLPIGVLFVAAQLVDFGWATLVLAGAERVRIQPGFLAASPLDLY
jgi:hypothetical protein